MYLDVCYAPSIVNSYTARNCHLIFSYEYYLFKVRLQSMYGLSSESEGTIKVHEARQSGACQQRIIEQSWTKSVDGFETLILLLMYVKWKRAGCFIHVKLSWHASTFEPYPYLVPPPSSFGYVSKDLIDAKTTYIHATVQYNQSQVQMWLFLTAVIDLIMSWQRPPNSRMDATYVYR